jgi:uncharacterized protein
MSRIGIVSGTKLAMPSQDLVFTVSVAAISRVLILRDRVIGRMGRIRAAASHPAQIERRSIASGGRRLDAVFVQPADSPAHAALLICHGIGETVDHWIAAQTLLAEHDVASLVFDYAGYGRSPGPVDWRCCEENTLDAFHCLLLLAPALPVSLLGFSMGSGIAASVAGRIRAERLILCSAFTSYREAACVLGVPRPLAGALPRIWDGAESLNRCSLPVLVVHCEKDRAFPLWMASRLANSCGDRAELVVVADHAHNQPFYRPSMTYWSHILARVIPRQVS